VAGNTTVPSSVTIHTTAENPIEESDAYLIRTSVGYYDDYAFDRSIAEFRARSQHPVVCQGGTAMGGSVGTSDRVYSMTSFYVSFRSTILYFRCSAMRTRMSHGGVGHVSFIDR